MRRTLTALPAIALTLALGACDKPQAAPPQPEGDNNGSAGQQGGAFDDLAALASDAGSSMRSRHTVTITTKTTGGTDGGLGELTCQVDLAKNEESCTGAAEVVITNNTMYKKMGTDPAKPWTKTDMSTNPMAAAGESVEKYTDLNEVLPSGTTIESHSAETVDGQDATKYETVTDVKKAAAEATNPMQKSMLEFALKAGITEQRHTIWIGPDNLPVQIETRSPAGEIMGRQTPASTNTIKFKDWGKPVTIEAPSPDQVSEGFPIPGIGG